MSKLLKSTILPVTILLTACGGVSNIKQPTGVVLGGATYHHKFVRKMDGVNPAIGLQYGKHEVGVYDNSHAGNSVSPYYTYQVYKKHVGRTTITTGVRAGAAYYPKDKGYKTKVLPVVMPEVTAPIPRTKWNARVGILPVGRGKCIVNLTICRPLK